MNAMTPICPHITRNYEIAENREYRHAWLKTCLKCEKTNLFSSHMFECLECHVFIHRDCWQLAESSSRKSTIRVPMWIVPRPLLTQSGPPEQSAIAVVRKTKLRAVVPEILEQSVTATVQEPRPRRTWRTRHASVNTSVQALDRGEPVPAEYGDCCPRVESVFSPYDLLSKIHKEKRLRLSKSPSNVPPCHSREYVDLLSRVMDESSSTARLKIADQVHPSSGNEDSPRP